MFCDWVGVFRGVPDFEVVHIIITGPRFAAVVVLCSTFCQFY